ncbi:phosphate ABC transporter substrate-binding protein PstS family protein [Parasalinivibrio latis]
MALALGVQPVSAHHLKDYRKVEGVTGNLSSMGSDTLANLMTFWAEAFERHYPNVNVQIQSAGSATAPPALIQGTAQLGPMSREMRAREVEGFETRYGYKPVAVPVAIDALAIFVHHDNPLPSLTFEQVDAVFSRNLRCGATTPIRTWGQLGLEGNWKNRDIQLFGRNSVSGTYGYFKTRALCKGDFLDNVNEQPGSASVVQAVSSSLHAIGYSGVGFQTTSVRAVPLVRDDGVTVAPSAETAADGSYPLARFLYVYVNKEPNKPLPKLTQEFIRLVLSEEGQAIVAKDGYVPLPQNIIRQTLRQLDISP